jgi:peptide deformylase
MTSPEEDRPQVGAELLVSVFNDLSAVSEDYDIDLKGALSYDDSQFPQLVEQVAYLLEDETEESARNYLMGFLSPVIEHSIVHLYTVNETENINDQKKERNKAILDRSIDIAIGIGKVAAGAVLAGLALSAIQKRRR